MAPVIPATPPRGNQTFYRKSRVVERWNQKAEVILKVFPGQTFDAEVEKLAYFTPQGQLQPSGVIPLAPTGDQSALPIGVVLKLSKPIEDLPQIPGGAVGTAAIYTDRAKATHVIRRVMIRMQTYTNYFLP